MLFGREPELAILKRLNDSKRAEFLAVYGRRRIGKTYLIYEFFKDKGIYFEVTGIKNATKKEQLRHLYKNFSMKFKEENISPPSDWIDAFDMIKNVIEKLDPNIKFILFLDELPWLCGPKSGFLSALDYAWNHDFSRHPNVILTVCGSAASWIIKKIVKNKGGLHGRLSAKIRLQPFTLSETEHFLLNEGVQLKRKQLIELYMAIGGVAKYLMNVPKGKSATQIIDELCFSPQGFLFSEFQELYQSLFDESERHIAIVTALAKKRKGISQEELLEATNLPTGGRVSETLEELEESGFILKLPSFGKKGKDRKIRLIDEYTFFYLSWIEKSRSTLLRSSSATLLFWNKICKTPSWHEWAGHAFENICLKHVDKIKSALGIAGVFTEESHFRYTSKRKNSDLEDKGAEIDLIIDRRDDCIHLCEIKFCNTEFVIDGHYARELERKKEVFQRVTKTRKTIFITMITPFGVTKNEHYKSHIDSEITIDNLF